MGAYKVRTPVEGFTGEVAGVAFVKGEATTDDGKALAYFRSAGYHIAPADEAATGGEPSGIGPFDPAKASVDSVLAYLDGAGEVEARRVLEAEAAGKARKTLLEQAEAVIAREAAADEAARKNQETQP